jgi:hypothetical protein
MINLYLQEAEPGTPWLNLDEKLRLRSMGLAVYPTSAPAPPSGAGKRGPGWRELQHGDQAILLVPGLLDTSVISVSFLVCRTWR